MNDKKINFTKPDFVSLYKERKKINRDIIRPIKSKNAWCKISFH